ncbi:uncharacterized protein SPAPADRAFT_134971 [Spathaspora passalidarum NRRL Y-27907]|uniref:Dipeptidyl aminopeptidase n=1 Tax=Spathaspora passalidarum (strain NRRL Y-27907 / 11-Y1) TaxID=619300 RepID=G3AHI2_SPAPN|nr:uncharacterized protein SPAPADRAFT_134971 [Spathaspora passalidarum NRRL Y-27907]EGW34146.1 hypothetical protein SPAPADRAFT_134971 [Spathaspora passalidarum NRRL Y-27907]
MFSRNSPPSHVEEYEMVDQQEWSEPERLPDLEESTSGQTPSVDSRGSTDSESSVLFEDIENYSARQGKDIDDFNMSPTFQNTFIRYKKEGVNAKVCSAITAFFVLLWVGGIIAYSQLSPSQLASKLTWQTDVSVSGSNITLNKYDASFRNLTLQSYWKGHYATFQKKVDWLSPQQYPKEGGTSGGGFYLTNKGNEIIINQINTKYEKVFLSSIQFAYSNNFFYVKDYILNPAKAIDDKNAVQIVKTDVLEQWRKSSFALYWVYNPITGAFTPIQPPPSSKRNLEKQEILEKLHFAEFSPNGNYILFGHNHDLFIYQVSNEQITQITHDGSKNIFNGKPDWVYEEEVQSKLYWWSPNENNLIFAKLNDTNVDEVELDYYIKPSDEIGAQYDQSDQKSVEGVNQYPIHTAFKYPKPGTPNPIVTLFNYHVSEKKLDKLEDKDSSLGEEYIIYDATWIDDTNFLIKNTDRTSRVLARKLYQPGSEIKVINMQNATAEYNGWIEKQFPITVIRNKDSPENKYIDVIVQNGRNRLALFDNASSSSPKILTDGEFDVISKAVFDPVENFIYFLTNTRSSMDSHLMGIDMNDSKMTPITNIEEDGFYEAHFSPDGQFLNLFYSGPEQPWQKLFNMADIHESENKKEIIVKAKAINYYDVTKTNLNNVNIPTVVFKEIRIDKDKDGNPIKLNVKEILPPNFNTQRKYPLFVHVYGGPGSQNVQKQFDIGFLNIISAKLDAIVLVIDPRGTGGKGWKFASYATNNIGYWEPRDITTLTSEYIAVNKKFIDKDKVALWGWSYGGFTTLKCLEYDHGETFKFGMAVAPVTNWLFYDSIYTERYMNKPDQNPNYEKHAQIKDFNQFKSPKRFLIVHGTSDDNVHIQNSMWFIDRLTYNKVENFDVQIFPDSAHDISYDNAASVVYDRLFNWVRDAFMGKFD